MITTLTLTSKKSIAVLAVLLVSIFSFSAKAALVQVTSNTNWSAITTGSGLGGVPNATDDIWVYDGAVLTINQNADAKSLKLGDVNGSPSVGGLVVNTGTIFNVYGNFDAVKPSNFGGKGLYNTVVLNGTSQMNVMGITNTHYTKSGTGTLTNTGGAPLPVEFISFTATKINATSAMLNFATAWEINNRGFEVERSTNGVNWMNIGFVEGHNNSNTVLNYSFPTSLAGISSSVVYYRLKQVDFNGQFEYSQVRSIRLGAATAKVESIYPNPAMNKVSVSLAGIEAGNKAKVSIMDMTGKVVMVQDEIATEGNFTIEMNIENLKTGNYIVNVSSDASNFNTKLIKL